VKYLLGRISHIGIMIFPEPAGKEARVTALNKALPV
jgi:hypothetical protein